MKVYHFDAFSEQPNKGNPAGVVLDAENLTEVEMQKIATVVGFSETAFISPSKTADIQIRYFTPGHEMNLCGHGTVASLIALQQIRGVANIRNIETKAGIIDASIKVQGSSVNVIMKQLPAKFIQFEGEPDNLTSVLGLDKNDIEKRWPIVYGNTGIWTLLVPIRKLSCFKKMVPNTKLFPEILTQFSHSSIHPFCLETINPTAQMHGRHFSSPYSGTIEDPTTGTASGVMGAYYLNYISKENSNSLLVEQGQEIGKNGFVRVNIERLNDQIEVEIEGSGVFVKEITLNE